MSKTDSIEYIQCQLCKTDLLYLPVETSITGMDINLPYCPNKVCNHYGLFTMEGL